MDKVVKKEHVKKAIYVVLFLIAIIAISISLVLKIFINCNHIKSISDVLSNLGYGVFASTFVALLIEIRDVRVKNSEFTKNYVITMRQFLNDYIYMMSLYRDQAVILNKNYEFEAKSWSEWRDIVDQWELKKTIGMEDNYNINASKQNCDELKSAISKVIEDIDYIIQAGPLVVINGVDDISYDRMIMIKHCFDSVMHNELKYPEELFTIMGNMIVEKCNSWFLLEGLDKETFTPALGYHLEISQSRMHKLFDE